MVQRLYETGGWWIELWRDANGTMGVDLVIEAECDGIEYDLPVVEGYGVTSELALADMERRLIEGLAAAKVKLAELRTEGGARCRMM